MRQLFPGYFTPTSKEFDDLWREATFGFDASVLLGLYRLSMEARQVFFDALRALGGRVFLPNQAAHEYLRNRMNAISARSGFYQDTKNEIEKFVQALETRAQDHSLPKGPEMIEAAKEARRRIGALADSALDRERDLLRSDDLLMQLANLFETTTGPPYDPQRFEEICKMAVVRYDRKIPPGYKDVAKAEPERYGDVLIWFQLIDQAAASKKPIVFITRDAKEDWWQQHKGETLGARPELAQEMKHKAGVRFYMYTMQRFLEFAQEFLHLKPESTKRAASEIEQIEKQDKEAANKAVPAWASQAFAQDAPINSVTYMANVAPSAVSYGTNWHVDLDVPWYQEFTAVQTESPEEATEKNRYLRLLPIHGHVFKGFGSNWKCEVTGLPKPTGTDRLCYRLTFRPQDGIRSPRNLKLWVSEVGLYQDSAWRYKADIFRLISDWLGSYTNSDELYHFG